MHLCLSSGLDYCPIKGGVFFVVDSLFYVPSIVCGCSVFDFVCISLCLFYLCNHFDEEETAGCFALVVFLMSIFC